MRPGGLGTSRMIDSDVTDLPQPDSPTMPSVSPGASEKLTPSTAANTLPPERNSVRRFFDFEEGSCGHAIALVSSRAQRGIFVASTVT